MRHCGFRRRNRCDFARLQMNAMAEHGFWREQTGHFLHISVIARTHVKMMHLFDLLAVFGEVRLDVSAELFREFGGAAHQSFRASHGKAWTECVLETAIACAVPFATKPFAFQ